MVGLHRENEALLRDVEELFLEFTHQDVGALYQARDFVEQVVIVNRLSADLLGRSLQLAIDLCFSRTKAGNDSAIALQRCVVLVCVGDGDR